jgi:hypothetical protein
MSDAARDLALRKELLLARSSLYRLKLQGEVEAVRRSLSWPRAGMAIVSAGPARKLAFDLAVDVVGRDRVARYLTMAHRALAVARLAITAVGLFRASTECPQAGAETEAGRHP